MAFLNTAHALRTQWLPKQQSASDVQVCCEKQTHGSDIQVSETFPLRQGYIQDIFVKDYVSYFYLHFYLASKNTTLFLLQKSSPAIITL